MTLFIFHQKTKTLMKNLLFSLSLFAISTAAYIAQAGHYGTVTANNSRGSAPTLTLTAPNSCSDIGNLKSGKIEVRNFSAATADNFISSQSCFTVGNLNTNRNVWVQVTIPAGSGISGLYFYSSTAGVTPQPTSSTNLRTATIQVYNGTTCTPALNCGSTWDNAITDIRVTAPHIRGIGTERVDVVPGNTYRIEISTTTFSTDPDYNFDVFVVPLGAAPANNNCSNAIPFTNDVACNLGAKAACNTDIPDCAFTLENSVFYSFVKPGTGPFEITISNVQCEGGGNDMQSAIYLATTSNCNTNLNTVGNQIADRCFTGSYTYVINNSDPPGTEYIIWFDGNAGAACTWGIEVANVCVTPTISSQPTNQTICSTSSGSLAVTASAGPYQWQYNNGGTWTNVANGTPAGFSFSGNTSSTLNITTSNAPQGTYQFRVVVGETGCTVISNVVTVTVPGATRLAPLGPICSGTQLNFEAFPSTGATYSWTTTPPAGLTTTPSSGSASTFSTTPTNSTAAGLTLPVSVNITHNGVTCTHNFNPTVNPILTPTFTFGSSGTFCEGATVPTLPATSTNSITGTWSPTSVSNTTSNTYTFTPSAGQCANPASYAVTITPSQTPDFLFGTSLTICQGESVPTLPATSENGITGTWSPTAVSNTASNTYTFTPTAGVCATSHTFTVTVNTPTTPTFSFGTSLTICSGGTVPVLPTNSTNSITGTWSPATVSNTASDTYSFTPDAGQCATTTSFVVTVNPVVDPTFTFGSSGTFCEGATVPTLPATSTNSITGTWSPAAVSNTTSNTYTFTPSAGQCANPASYAVTITPSQTPDFLFGTSLTICQGESVPTLPATSENGITGTWSPTAVSNTASNTYTFTPSAGVCATSHTFTVTVNTPTTPTFSFGTSLTICSGGSAPALPTTSTNSITGTWSPTSVSNTASDTYTFTPTAGQCANTFVLNFVVNDLPTADATGAVVIQSDCGLSTGSITGIVAGGAPTLTYSWTNASSVVVGSSLDLTNQPAGNYTLTVTDGNSCSSQFGPFTITNPSAPAAPTISGNPASVCEGDAFTLTASSGAPSPTFNWNLANGTTATGNSIVIDPATLADGGDYSVTVTSSSCVSAPATVNVVVNATPVMTSTTTAAICSGETLNIPLAASVGASFSWVAADNSNVTGESTSAQSTSFINNTLTNTASTNQIITYTVTPTATIGGCVGDDQTVTVTVNTLPDMTSLPVIAPSDCGLSTGSISGAVVSGNPVLSYSWTNASAVEVGTAADLTNQPAGDYSLTVTDGNACESQFGPFTIINPNSPTVPAPAVVDASCTDLNGSITIGGGFALYELTGVNPVVATTANSTGVFTSVTPGDYSIVVTDVANCVSAPLTVTIIDDSLLDCDGDGVTNGDEEEDGTDPNDPCSYEIGSITLTPGGDWNDEDCDGDGVTNEDEVTDGTDPNDPCSYEVGSITLTPGGDWNEEDCDGDGVTNEDEVADGTDPLDPCDYLEGSITLPQTGEWLEADCDGDGVTNEDEVVDGTDPNDPCEFLVGSITLTPGGDWNDEDCDGDGVTNEDEVTDGTDPNDPCSYEVGSITLTPGGDWNAEDCDGDGVANEDEVADGTDPLDPCDYLEGSITLPQTGEWLEADCDGDGVTNEDEVADGTDPNDPCSFEFDSITLTPGGDWNEADCDGDGVTNEDELTDGTDPYDPCDYVLASQTVTPSPEWEAIDCDGDGVTNGDELVDGTNPQDPCSFVAASITLTVTVECLGDLVVIIPTIFTPNGDGSNDIFYPTVVNATAMQASIYNRWGQLIYEWDGTAGGWDGRTVAGVESSEATYFYLFYITDKDNVVHQYQGHFALKR
jgi:gliding motility-associated-like protein